MTGMRGGEEHYSPLLQRGDLTLELLQLAMTICLAGAGPGVQAGVSPCSGAGVSFNGGET
jgi:hypothetical protein